VLCVEDQEALRQSLREHGLFWRHSLAPTAPGHYIIIQPGCVVNARLASQVWWALSRTERSCRDEAEPTIARWPRTRYTAIAHPPSLYSAPLDCCAPTVLAGGAVQEPCVPRSSRRPAEQRQGVRHGPAPRCHVNRRRRLPCMSRYSQRAPCRTTTSVVVCQLPALALGECCLVATCRARPRLSTHWSLAWCVGWSGSGSDTRQYSSPRF
jgi:hypothetical protein